MIAEAIRRTVLDRGEIDDVVMGCALQQGSTGFNTARQAALRLGLPPTMPVMTIDRQCGSGLMAIATAAKQIVVDVMCAAVGGGVEAISLVQNAHINNFRAGDPKLVHEIPSLYMPMIETVELVADGYGVNRNAQDEYALHSHMRTAQADRRFKAEIAPNMYPDSSAGSVMTAVPERAMAFSATRAERCPARRRCYR